MSDLLLSTVDDDLDITTGDLRLTETDVAVRQHLQQRLRMFLGEWFLDLGRGIPFYEQVLIKNANPGVLDAIFKDAILTTPGVIELLSFDLSFDNALRTLTLTFEVRSTDGIIEFTDTFGEEL